LFKSIRFEEEKQSSVNILRELNDVKKEINDLNVKVNAITTDNEAKMVAARALFKDEHNVPTPGCAPHAGNLVTGDILQLQTVECILADCNKVLFAVKNGKLKQFIRTGKVEKEARTENQRVGVTAPGDTRWNTNLDSLRWLKSNKEDIESLCFNAKAKEYLKPDIKQIIINDDFWRNIDQLLSTLSPIGNGTDIMQGDFANPAVVFHIFSQWDSLYQQSDNDELSLNDTILESVRKRWDLISDDVHAACYVLDPRFINCPIGAEDLIDASNYLKTQFGDDKWENKIQKQFLDFRTRKGIFADSIWSMSLYKHSKSHEIEQKDVNINDSEDVSEEVNEEIIIGIEKKKENKNRIE